MTKHMQTKRNIDAALLLVQEKMDVHLAANSVAKKPKPSPKKPKAANLGRKPAPDKDEDIFSAKTDSLDSDEDPSTLFDAQNKPETQDSIENFVKRNFVLQSEQKNQETIKRYIASNASNPHQKKSLGKTPETPLGKTPHGNFNTLNPSALQKLIAQDSTLSKKADETYPAPSELGDSQ
jgi:hypothetical protein